MSPLDKDLANLLQGTFSSLSGNYQCFDERDQDDVIEDVLADLRTAYSMLTGEAIQEVEEPV
jgi:hypothetical protein